MSTDQDRRAPACVLVIFGASGDLTARKLLPALERLADYEALPAEFVLVGVARTPMTDEEFGGYVRQKVAGTDNPRWAELAATARYVHGDYDDPPRMPGWPMCWPTATGCTARRAAASITSPPRPGCSVRSR